MLAILVSLSVAATPGPASFASPGLLLLNVPKDAGRFFTEHFAQQLVFEGAKVVTADEIAQLIGFERQKQLLGCTDDTSCMVEITNALGVDGLITGSLGKAGEEYQVNLKILSAGNGEILAAYSGRARGDGKLLDELSNAARTMAPTLFQRLGKKPLDVAGAPKPSKLWVWSPLIGTAAFGGAATFFALSARDHATRLRGEDGEGSSLTLDEARQARSDGRRAEVLSAVFATAAVGAAVTAIALAIANREPEAETATQVSASLTPAGAGLSFTVRFGGPTR